MLVVRLTVAVVVILALAGSFQEESASAERIETPFTAHVTVLEVVDPGIWTYPGGNVHIRNMLEHERIDQATDQRMLGEHWTVMNTNLNHTNQKTASWGTFRIDVTAGGTWAGTWVWSPSSNVIEVTGRGSGALNGLQLRAEVTPVSETEWTVEGSIIEP